MNAEESKTISRDNTWYKEDVNMLNDIMSGQHQSKNDQSNEKTLSSIEITVYKDPKNNDVNVDLTPKEYERIVHGDIKKLNKTERNIRRILKTRNNNTKDSRARVSEIHIR